MRWMGAKNSHNDEVEILITASQQDDIIKDLVSTGSWCIAEEEIPDPRSMPKIENTPGSFRLVFKSENGYPLALNLWLEECYHMSIDIDKPEVPDCVAWNSVLVDTEYHPDPVHMRYGSTTLQRCEDQKTQILPPPRFLANSAAVDTKIYILRLLDLLEALLVQVASAAEHTSTEPLYQFQILLQYLFLERPYQRGLLMPLLSETARSLYDKIVSKYKRKLTTRYEFDTKRLVSFEPWNVPIEDGMEKNSKSTDQEVK